MRTKEGRNQALQNAIRKYGAEAFTRRVLVIADDWDYLCDLERKAIIAFDTLAPRGYNLTVGGEGVVGRVHTALAAVHMSAGQKKRFSDPNERRRLAEQGDWKDRFPEKFAELNAKRTERMKSPEMRARLSEKAREQFSDPQAREEARQRGLAQWTEEARQMAAERSRDAWAHTGAERRSNHSAATRAGMADETVRAKVNAAAKKRAADPEWRRKSSEARKGKGLGRKNTEETKQKMAETRRKLWQDPEYRAKQAAARARRKAD